MFRAIAIAGILSLAGVSGQAATVVIDFDAATPGGLLTADYAEDGFTMKVLSGHYDIWASGGTGGSRYLGLDTLPGAGYSVVELTGGVFDLVSLDVLYAPYANFGESQTVWSSAGGVAALDAAGTQTFSGAAWSNLSWIRLNIDVEVAGPGFDNITFDTVVPVPAAGWLCSGALGVLGFVKRRGATA